MTFVKTAKQREAINLLTSPAKYILLYGGSRSGKTFIFIYALTLRALKEPHSRHLIVRFAFNHAKQSIWYDTFPKVLSLCFPGIKPSYNRSDWFIEFQNGSQIWIGGLDDKERTEKILGNEYSTIFINEASQVSYSSYSTVTTRLAQKTNLKNKLYIDCNPPSTTHWIYKLFIKGINPESNESVDRSLYGHMQMNPDDNLDNLPADFIDSVLGTLSYRQQRRFRYGEFLDDVEGALWHYDLIDRYRVNEHPELTKVIVAVDPSGTAKQTSDEAGLVVVGYGVDGHAYVLEDKSGIMTPNQWATLAIACLKRWEGNYIVAEVNQGWDMVRTVIHNIDSTVRVVSVVGSKGKVARAEPVIGLYERGMVHHVGLLPKLEDEMTTWDSREGKISPGRIDALVYGILDLLCRNKTEFVLV